MKILTDEDLTSLYHDPKLGIKEVLKIIKKDYGIKTSESTLLRYIKSSGIKTRKDLGIKKNKLGKFGR